MRMTGWWWAGFLAVVGCKTEVNDGTYGDGGPEAGADADADADSDADGDGDGDPETVRVHVFALGEHRAEQADAAGATVAFDLPSGERVEAVADAQGVATFDGVDWSGGGKAAVVAHLDGTIIGGWTALTEADVARDVADDGELGVFLGWDPQTSAALVPVSGTAVTTEPDRSVAVYSNIRGTGYENGGHSWSILVEPDEPFTLVAYEYELVPNVDWLPHILGWQIVEHGGVSEPTTIDLDMTVNPATSTSFTGSLRTPGDSVGTFFRDASLDVYGISLATPGSLGIFGYITSRDLSADRKLWTYAGEYVEPDSLQEPATLYVWSSPRTIWQSWVIVPGLPSDGLQALAFPEPPILSLAPGEDFELGGTLEWQLAERDRNDADLHVQVYISDVRDNPRMLVEAPAGTTSAVIPVPPSDVDPAALLGDDTVAVVVVTEVDQSHQWSLRAGVSDKFGVVP